MSDTPPTIDWRAWEPEAFVRAAREDKPILLSLVAPWCEHCVAMDRTTYARADVVRLVDARFVAIRVDTDRRPDINERYNLGGWPTTAFLTPEGQVFGGGTFIDAERMPGVLADVAEAFVHRRGEIATRTAAARGSGQPQTPEMQAQETDVRNAPTEDRGFQSSGNGWPVSLNDDPVEWLSSQLLESFDPEEGGFGAGPKFPHVPALTLALERYGDTRNPLLRDLVTASLDRLTRLSDPNEGGFFRYASNRDWSGPHTAKLLADNADLIRLYLDAGEALERRQYLDLARRTLDWVQRVLARPRGGFAASQSANSSYYERAAEADRTLRPAPKVDEAAYADSSAAMIAVFFRAAEALGDRSLRDQALRSLDEMMLAGYRPGSGVAHVIGPEPDVWGLLADQVRVVEALLLAHMATDQLPYSMLAAEVMEYATAAMWDEHEGGLHDRARSQPDAELGLLSRRFRPFVTNCEAARMLFRLSLVTRRKTYLNSATQTLASLGIAYREDPLVGASYGLAVREITEGRLPRGWALSYVDWRLSEPDDD
jgi:uncharacterized protein YyaL (SSP411 family)